ncbi:MAG: CBS domain-containing protein [Alphaproteobacteria bacterium]
MQVREFMTKDIQLVDPETLLKDAALKMREADTGFLPVGENDRLIGTITDRDIAIRAIADGKDPCKAKVRDAMTDELYYCYEDQPAEEAAAIMSEHQIRRLPILNRQKRLVGVVSLGDLSKWGTDALVGHTIEEISQTRH